MTNNTAPLPPRCDEHIDPLRLILRHTHHVILVNTYIPFDRGIVWLHVELHDHLSECEIHLGPGQIDPYAHAAATAERNQVLVEPLARLGGLDPAVWVVLSRVRKDDGVVGDKVVA